MKLGNYTIDELFILFLNIYVSINDTWNSNVCFACVNKWISYHKSLLINTYWIEKYDTMISNDINATIPIFINNNIFLDTIFYLELNALINICFLDYDYVLPTIELR